MANGRATLEAEIVIFSIRTQNILNYIILFYLIRTQNVSNKLASALPKKEIDIKIENEKDRNHKWRQLPIVFGSKY